ncbi:hypothetical protein [Zooshikella ganghwensis]|uniref:Uncharacterized protein n=1 Tax=Zooshikella ganghwensis TaxID=202772 RepID=A0A4V1IMU3_9GAMM|nr:hypothetical protein [Zooshikella ganghwensis]RDH41431.1 hypothetical protein B9G39_28655 [Zooshikella ganghwensis]
MQQKIHKNIYQKVRNYLLNNPGLVINFQQGEQKVQTFEVDRLISSLKTDKSFDGFEFDNFRKVYQDLTSKYAKEIEKLERYSDNFLNESVNITSVKDSEKLVDDILNSELVNHGVDWRRFYAGKKEEQSSVDSYLSKFNLPFKASDILDGKALIKLSQQGSTSAEVISGRQADHISGYHGDQIKSFCLTRADHYHQIKDAANSGSFFNTIGTMLSSGIFSFGIRGGKATAHALKSGATAVHAIVAGIAALGGLEAVGVIVTAMFVVLWVVALIFSRASILTAFINRTNSAILLDEIYIEHGETPIIPAATNYEFPDHRISAPEEQSIDIQGASTMVFIGYYFQKGDIGLLG